MIALDHADDALALAKLAQQYFPQLTIHARARNRQHAMALMHLGIRHVTRETLHSALKTAGAVLGSLGLAQSQLNKTLRTFEAHDAQLLAEQVNYLDDEDKMIASAQRGREELQRLFVEDKMQQTD